MWGGDDVKQGIASGSVKAFQRDIFNMQLRALRAEGVKLFFEMEKALQDLQIQREHLQKLT